MLAKNWLKNANAPVVESVLETPVTEIVHVFVPVLTTHRVTVIEPGVAKLLFDRTTVVPKHAALAVDAPGRSTRRATTAKKRILVFIVSLGS